MASRRSGKHARWANIGFNTDACWLFVRVCTTVDRKCNGMNPNFAQNELGALLLEKVFFAVLAS